MEFRLSETNILSSASRAFENKDSELVNLLGSSHPYFNLDQALKEKSGFSQDKRNILVETLRKQYECISASEENLNRVLGIIDSLKDPDAYTVTTGQQLHLFVGPAFILYKVLATVKLTERLKLKYPEKNFVPVYWLASEDHDIDEIRDNTLFKKNYRWNTGQKGACGRFKTEGISELITEMLKEINVSKTSQELLEFMKFQYENSETLSEATLKIIHHLFGGYGLVCIDADKKAFKKIFIPVIKNDILDRSNYAPFNTNSNDLNRMGLSTQLHGREINFFYLNDSSRERIVFEEGLYSVLNTGITFTPEAIKNEIETHPERFSPNAMLRPLFQESVLPNLAYIAGNAEVNYWLQIHNLFSINNLTPPNLILRPSVWIVPAKIAKWLENQNLDAFKVLTTSDEQELSKLNGGIQLDIKKEIQEFQNLKQRIQDTAAQIHTPDFKALLEKGKEYEKILGNIDKQAMDYSIKLQGESFLKLKDIQTTYLNIKSLQERNTHALEMLIKFENVLFSIKNASELEQGSAYIIPL